MHSRLYLIKLQFLEHLQPIVSEVSHVNQLTWSNQAKKLRYHMFQT